MQQHSVKSDIISVQKARNATLKLIRVHCMLQHVLSWRLRARNGASQTRGTQTSLTSRAAAACSLRVINLVLQG